MNKQTLDLAIVTSCHNYGKYLEDWAQSIVHLDEYRPRVCAIVDNGSTDTSPRDIRRAAQILKSAGIECRTARMPYANFGAARNRAVALSGDTEWVMHLDADDVLMTHALQDFAEIAPNADVVGFGYQRSGNLSAGPRNKTRTYSTHRGEKTLRSTAPCSGVSPFRRRFWEHTPYREDMRGGWDTALWIGFAHQNARFVPTRRPVFFYRQHADSIFNRRRISERKGKLVGVKLKNLRKPITDGVSIVVPIMPDSSHRDRSWEWVRRRYEVLHPDWEIIEGRVPASGKWRKGEAVARGLEQASHHTLIVADSDCIVSPDALERAVATLREEDVGWVVPHGLVHRVSQEMTDTVLNADPSPYPFSGLKVTYERKPYEGFAGGGMFVVDRSDYEAVGGIPLCFEGWGAEDECLAVVLNTLLEGQVRMQHDLWHLWHPTSRSKNVKQNKVNRQMLRLFLQFSVDPDTMWELTKHVREGGTPRTFANSAGSFANTILMEAIETHKRGKKIIKKGDLFRATDEEVRRHRARARTIARPVNGSLTSTVARLKTGG